MIMGQALVTHDYMNGAVLCGFRKDWTLMVKQRVTILGLPLALIQLEVLSRLVHFTMTETDLMLVMLGHMNLH